jgi:hypothetical protein
LVGWRYLVASRQHHEVNIPAAKTLQRARRGQLGKRQDHMEKTGAVKIQSMYRGKRERAPKGSPAAARQGSSTTNGDAPPPPPQMDPPLALARQETMDTDNMPDGFELTAARSEEDRAAAAIQTRFRSMRRQTERRLERLDSKNAAARVMAHVQ